MKTKKAVIMILMSALGVLNAYSQLPSYVPTNGLVGYWPFNGNANDESGNGNNGTVNGATLTADRNGVANKAYSFDGIDDLINVGNPNQLLNNPISYSQSVWIYLFDSPVNFNSYPIISKRHDDLGNDWATAVFRSSQNIWFFADDAYYSGATYAKSSTLSLGTWKHAVFIKEDNTFKIYLNGVLDVSIVDNHIMSGSSNDLVFGAQLAWPQYYKGLIDDIAIFNRVLSQQEITSLYAGCNDETATTNSLNGIVLKNSQPINLIASPSLGGQFSGDAITNNKFTPADANLGKNTVHYNFTNNTGCKDSTDFSVIVYDTLGNVCSTYDTLKIKVKFTTGLYANTINTVKFYPNPTKDVLFIDNGNYQAMNGYSIKIISLAGTVVYNQPITSQQVQISMNQFATKGLYIAQIIDSTNAIVDSKKIVLE